MKGWMFTAIVVCGAVGCSDDNNHDPPTILPDNSCLSVIPPPANGFDPPTPSTGSQECPGYDEQNYPPDIRDWNTTSNYGVTDRDTIRGCNGSTHLAWPRCSTVAAASGPTFKAGRTYPGDGDYDMDICPELQEAFPGGVDPMPMELRSQSSFQPADNGGIDVLGSVRIEVQDCLFYRGQYSLPGGQTFVASPNDGDYTAAFGEWIADDGHSGDDFAHAEIHEATALAVVKPFDSTNMESEILASGFFVQRNLQPNIMTLDVRTPAPSAATASMISCDAALDLDAAQTPSCPIQPGIAVVPAVQPGSTCRLRFVRDPSEIGVPDLVDFGCWAGNDTGGQCNFTRFNPDSCDSRIHFAGAFRATWDPPADLWLCSCQSPDPSTPGATIVVPIQGCADTSADPQSACADVCGGAGAACNGASEPACAIGDTTETIPPYGSIVGPAACDPSAPQLHERVSPSADFEARVVGNARIQVPEADVTRGVSMSLFFNVVVANGQPSAIDIADAAASIPDFDLSGHHVSDVQLFIGARQVGVFDDPSDPTQFHVPQGLGVYGIRAKVDGVLKGLNISNPNGFEVSGHVDLISKIVSLHIHGEDPFAEQDETKALTADLAGTIINSPPVADPSRTNTRPECSSHTVTPIVLDGTASSDPDGDPLAHFQWFQLEHGSPVSFGTGNVAVATTSLPLGIPTEFELHVYDPKLGAGDARTTVTVVDTTPPSLSVAPQAQCVWPPDHKMECFALGTDIEAVASDTCDPSPTVMVTSVSSNQSSDGRGDGSTDPDVSWTSTGFCIRRERSSGNARTYTVAITAQDHSGNATTRSISVVVPSDQHAQCP